MAQATMAFVGWGNGSGGITSWYDLARWRKVEGSVVTSERPDDLPDHETHVVILAPVSVGGNRRWLPKELNELTMGKVGQEIQSKWLWVGPPDNIGPSSAQTPIISYAGDGDAATIAANAIFKKLVGYETKEEERTGTNAQGQTYTYTVTVPDLTKPIEEVAFKSSEGNATPYERGSDPTCASATFFDDSFIVMDTPTLSATDREGSNAQIAPAIVMNFPCYFFGTSYIFPEIGGVDYVNGLTGVDSGNFSYTQSDCAHMVFTDDLHFYDESSMKVLRKETEARAATIIGLADTPLVNNIAYSSFTQHTGFPKLGHVATAGIHFYGDRRVYVSSIVGSSTVYFHDQTIYSGGYILNAEFLDDSSTSDGKQIEFSEFLKYGEGPNGIPTKGVLKFKGKSRNKWPQIATTAYYDNAACTTFLIGPTTFYGNSTHRDTRKKAYDLSWYTPKLLGTYAGDAFYLNGVLMNRHANYTENSINYNSVNASMISTFTGNAKGYSRNRFGNGADLCPYNFFRYSNGAVFSSYAAYEDPLGYISRGLARESVKFEATPPPLVTYIPPVYAEFHDFQGNGDWGDPLNWVRICGSSDSLPDETSAVVIKAGKTVSGNSSPVALCAVLHIEAGAVFSIELSEYIAGVFIEGLNEAPIEAGDVFIYNEGRNSGIIHAGSTFFSGNGRNIDPVTGKEGYIRSGAVFAMDELTGYDLLGTIVVGGGVMDNAQWSNFTFGAADLVEGVTNGPPSLKAYLLPELVSFGTYVGQPD